MLILFTLLLSFKSLLAVLCNLDANYKDASVITACLRTIPGDATELENFIDTVIAYVKNSPYALLFMEGPNGVTAFNTIEELVALKAQVGSKTAYEFYEKIYDIIGKLKDPHSTIQFPFLTSFTYFLPYGFAPVEGSGNERKLRLTANSATTKYVQNTGSNYTNYIIELLDFKNGGSDYQPATEGFSDLALDIGWAGHDPHALFNSVLKRGNLFLAIQLFRPEERYKTHVYLKGKNTDNSDVQITFPWLGIFNGETVPDSFNDLNPINAAGNEQARGRSKNSGKNIGGNSIKHILPRVLHNQIPPIFIEREKMMNELKRKFGGVDSDFSTNNERYQSRLITSMYEKILATRRHPPSRSPNDSPPTINLEVMYKYPDDNSCTIYADATNKLGYIRYTSFMQSGGDLDALTVFLDEFGKGYKKMVQKGVTDVIFDVRGNIGGLTLLVEEFTDFFFHNTVYPADLDTQILLGVGGGDSPSAGENYVEAVIQSLNQPIPYYKIEDGAEQQIDDILDPNETKTHYNKVGGYNSPFTAVYTQRGYFKMRGSTSIRGAYGGYSPFDPQHFYIISDGDCASCCGIFTKLAVESKAARVFGYGVNPTNMGVFSTYVPGNCAGSLLGTDQITNYRDALESAAATPGTSSSDLAMINQLLSLMPPEFVRQGVGFGVTDYEFFSRNPAHLDQTLYMVPAVVADVLPLQVSSEVDTIDVLKEIAQVTKTLYIDASDYCAAGEVIVDAASSCQTTDATAAHQVWGKTCHATAHILTDTCAFAHCEAGYYLAAVNTCAAMPKSPELGGGSAAVSMPVPALLLALLFAALMIL